MEEDPKSSIPKWELDGKNMVWSLSLSQGFLIIKISRVYGDNQEMWSARVNNHVLEERFGTLKRAKMVALQHASKVIDLLEIAIAYYMETELADSSPASKLMLPNRNILLP